MNVNVFLKHYLTDSMEGYDFDIYMISSVLGEYFGTTHFDVHKLCNVISKLNNNSTEYLEFEEKRYKYFDMEYIIRKDVADNKTSGNVVSNRYFLQDIHQSKLLVNIYTQSISSRELFPNINMYHDESASKIKKYKFNIVSVLIENTNNINFVRVMFSYNKNNRAQIKKDLEIIFSCFADMH